MNFFYSAEMEEQSETATGGEATIGVATGSNFQPPLELAIPLIDAALSVSLQFPLRFNPKKPLRFILAIVAATVAAVIWRRPLHLIFVYCGLKLPPVPAWMRAIISYINSHLPLRLHPFRWLCKTLIKNIKLCVSSGTLIWTVIFIICLPKGERNKLAVKSIHNLSTSDGYSFTADIGQHYRSCMVHI